eukprot:CAMPEP_0177599944 /NCGR_PEP_ID=MMETSP0419_2-20121207/13310_1 /TAXON_ID=582737 /ORGANISM="Tetraselmis sp., Strain GSL018" /LENGTH=284 /DNA_ID=CAMNT_0019092805 /DNA_START=527 /DNA_END=1381 /DNA_ORIENTATION=+
MGQRELQAKFQDVFQTPTYSNNNNWLRRKLMEAVGLQAPRIQKKSKQPSKKGTASMSPTKKRKPKPESVSENALGSPATQLSPEENSGDKELRKTLVQRRRSARQRPRPRHSSFAAQARGFEASEPWVHCRISDGHAADCSLLQLFDYSAGGGCCRPDGFQGDISQMHEDLHHSHQTRANLRLWGEDRVFGDEADAALHNHGIGVDEEPVTDAVLTPNTLSHVCEPHLLSDVCLINTSEWSEALVSPQGSFSHNSAEGAADMCSTDDCGSGSSNTLVFPSPFLM